MIGWLIGAMAVGGLIGGWANQAGYKEDYNKYMADTQASLDEIERKRAQDIGTIQTNFIEDKKEANKKADKQDAQSTLDEGYTAEGFNLGLDQIKAGQEEQTLAFNQQAQANSQAKGNALSSMAASGTRGSSMQQAVDLESAMNAMQLQAAEDKARAGDNIQLANLFQNANQSVNNIQTARTDALDLRKSYEAGGKAFNLARLNMDNINADAAARANEIKRQREYAQNNYSKGVQTAFLKGFGGGANWGANMASSVYKWSKI